MLRTHKTFAGVMVAVLVVIVFAYVYRWYNWRHWDDQIPDDMYVGKPLYSPTNKYKVIVFSESGGGAISPYCFDFVSVVPALMDTTNAFKRIFHVYAGGCHSLLSPAQNDKSPILEHAPLLKWKSDTELEISFDQKSAATGIKEFLFVGEADEGRIKIVPRHHRSWP